MNTIGEALAIARSRFSHSPSARIDAELLLAHALMRPRSRLHARPEEALRAQDRERFAALVERRAGGEPVAYLTGSRGFHAIEVEVGPSVLIPRPETEMLVELALTDLARRNEAGCRVLDLGTGSGCIALAIAHARPDAAITAVESVPAALELACGTARRLGLEHIRWVESDWFTRLEGETFDIIVSNPPYVAADDPHLEHGDLRFEPATALVGGADGLDALRVITMATPEHLAADGLAAVEHGFDQGDAVRAMFDAAGLSGIATLADAAGLSRVTLARSG